MSTGEQKRWVTGGLALLGAGLLGFSAWQQNTPTRGESVDLQPPAPRGETVRTTDIGQSGTESSAAPAAVSSPVRVPTPAEPRRLTREEAIQEWRHRPEVLRSEIVALPAVMLGKTPAQKLRLPLPGGGEVVAGQFFETAYGPGKFAIAGEIAGWENAFFSLARSGESFSGVISSLEGSYQYRGLVGGDTYVAEIDRGALASCSGALVPDPADIAAASALAPEGTRARRAFGDLPEGAEDEVSIVDIMVVYTDDVGSAFGGENGAESDIMSTIGLANQQFRASRANLSLRLTSTREVEYDEGGNADADLNAITRTDGVIDIVHQWRNEDGADLVAFSVRNMDDYAGLAWLGGNPEDSEFACFSVTLHSQLDWAFTHEVGHNLGCAHDRENSGGNGIFNYSFGYRFGGNRNEAFRTLMAYAPGLRLDLFSNPDLRHQGDAVGVANREDNARSIRRTGENVAEFRTAIVTTEDGPNVRDLTFVETSLSSNTPDGFPQPGEDFRISFDVFNATGLDLTGLRVELQTFDGAVDVLDASENLADVAIDGTVTATEAFRIALAGDTPAGSEISLLTTFKSDQGEWVTTATFTVVPRPIDLQIDSFTINDSPSSGRIGNGNGIAEPGEQFDLKINVANRGSSRMNTSNGPIRFSDPCLRFKTSDGETRVTTIEPGGVQASQTFRVIVDETCERGTRVDVELELTSDQTGTYLFNRVLVLGVLALGEAENPVRVEGDKPVRTGERLRIFPKVANTGDAMVTEVRGSITQLDAGLALAADVGLDYGTIAAGESAEPALPSIFEVTPMAPVFGEVGFTITFEAEGDDWDVGYRLPVMPPVTKPRSPGLGFDDGGNLTVTLPGTHNGMFYQLQWSDGLGSWQNIGEEIVGTGETVVVQPALPGGGETAPGGFVRVLRTAPAPE